MTTGSIPVSDERTAWIAGMRKLLDLLEANPGLMLDTASGIPGMYPDYRLVLHVPSYSKADPEALAGWEDALREAGIPFTPQLRKVADETPTTQDPRNYDLDAATEGLQFRIRARVQDVAERRTTGFKRVEQVEWVRLPVAAVDPEGPAAA